MCKRDLYVLSCFGWPHHILKWYQIYLAIVCVRNYSIFLYFNSVSLWPGLLNNTRSLLCVFILVWEGKPERSILRQTQLSLLHETLMILFLRLARENSTQIQYIANSGQMKRNPHPRDSNALHWRLWHTVTFSPSWVTSVPKPVPMAVLSVIASTSLQAFTAVALWTQP